MVLANGAVRAPSLLTGETITAQQVVIAVDVDEDFLARYGVLAPLQAAEHFYLVTEPLERFTEMRPTLRVPDEEAYYKFDAELLLRRLTSREALGGEGIPATLIRQPAR